MAVAFIDQTIGGVPKKVSENNRRESAPDLSLGGPALDHQSQSTLSQYRRSQYPPHNPSHQTEGKPTSGGQDGEAKNKPAQNTANQPVAVRKNPQVNNLCKLQRGP